MNPISQEIRELRNIKNTKGMYLKINKLFNEFEAEKNQNQIEAATAELKNLKADVNMVKNQRKERVLYNVKNTEESLQHWVNGVDKAVSVVDDRRLNAEKQANALKYEEAKFRQQIRELRKELEYEKEQTKKVRYNPEFGIIMRLENEIDKMKTKVNTACNIQDVYSKLFEQMKNNYREYGQIIARLEATLRNKKSQIQTLEKMYKSGANIAKQYVDDTNSFIIIKKREQEVNENQKRKLQGEYHEIEDRERQMFSMMNALALEHQREQEKKAFWGKHRKTLEHELAERQKDFAIVKEVFQVSDVSQVPHQLQCLRKHNEQLDKTRMQMKREYEGFLKVKIESEKEMREAEQRPDETNALAAKIEELRAESQAQQDIIEATERQVKHYDTLQRDLSRTVMQFFQRAVAHHFLEAVPLPPGGRISCLNDEIIMPRDQFAFYLNELEKLFARLQVTVQKHYDGDLDSVTGKLEFEDWVEKTFTNDEGKEDGDTSSATGTTASADDDSTMGFVDNDFVLGSSQEAKSRSHMKYESKRLMENLLKDLKNQRAGDIKQDAVIPGSKKRQSTLHDDMTYDGGRRNLTMDELTELYAELKQAKMRQKASG